MRIRLASTGTDSRQKVACIKALRCISGFGLKEAKDAVEFAMDGETIDIDVAPGYADILLRGEHDESIDTLKANGFVFGGVATKRTAVLDALRDSAKVSIDSKDYDLAISVINVLKEHDFA